MISARAASILAPVAFLLAMAALFHLTAPATGSEDGNLILDRAARWAGAAPPEEAAPVYPASTAWIAAPLSLAQRVGMALAEEPSRDYLERTREGWRRSLRLVFCLLGALVVLEALAWGAELERSISGGAVAEGRPGRRWCRGEGVMPAALTAGLLVATPALALSVAHLLPAMPAALLAILLLRATTASRLAMTSSRWRTILAIATSGLLLAWFSFLWPVVALTWGVSLIRSSRRRSGVGLACASILVALAVGPGYLLHPLEIPRAIFGEWHREGGWGGPGGDVPWDLLGLVLPLGPGAFLLLAAAVLAGFRHRSSSFLCLPALLWVVAVAVPAASGVQRPASVQWSVAPILASWGVAVLGSSRLRFRSLARALTIAVLVAALPARVALSRQSRDESELQRVVRAELSQRAAANDLVLSEVSFAEDGRNEDPAAERLLFVLPRDSRNPGRYDYAYWPRWYAGFRWVLLSSGRVREQVERPDARLPRSFYAAVEHDGVLVHEWGGAARGYRLYRLRDGSAWNRPFTEGELRAIEGGPGTAWFVGRLASAYLDAGAPRVAEALLRRGLEWEPGAPGLHNNLGTVYLRLGDFGAAAGAFEEGLRREPDSFELVWNFGLACSGAGLWGRGEALFRRAAAMRPDYAPVHYELARTFIGQDKADLARQAFQRYLELAPASPRRAEIEGVLARLPAASSGGG